MVELRRIESMLPESEYSVKFLQGMLDRMAVSFAKYGAVKDAYPNDVSALGSMRRRLQKYDEDGNTEWLIDAANFLMIEFMHPSREGAHYLPTSSTESPGRMWRDGDESTRRNNG
jgi:hypothetical protein